MSTRLRTHASTCVVLFAYSMVVALVLPAEAFARKWTSHDGKFTVEAEFVRKEGTNVVLRRQNGKEFSVPMQRLSREDLVYVLKQESAGKPDADDGPKDDADEKAGDGGQLRIEAPKPKMPDPPEKEIVQWSRAGAKQLQFRPPGKWNYRPTALCQPGPWSKKPISVEADSQRFCGLLYSAPSETKFVVMSTSGFGVKPKSTGMYREGNELQLYDGAKGRLIRKVGLDKTYRLVGLSPLAQTVALTTYDQEDLTIWSLVHDKKIGTFRPYGDKTDTHSSNSVLAVFPDEGHLSTCLRDRSLTIFTLWSLNTGKAIYESTFPRGFYNYVLSPDSRSMLFLHSSEKSVVVVDLTEGKSSGIVSTGGRGYGRPAISHDGRRLAATDSSGGGQSYVGAWDLDAGKQIAEIEIPARAIFRPLWVRDHVIFYGLRHEELQNPYSMVDFQKKRMVWHYGMGNLDPRWGPNERLWVTGSLKGRFQLASVGLPGPELAAGKPVAGAKPLLKRGDSVALKTQFANPPGGFPAQDFSATARQNIVDGLTRVGITVDDKAAKTMNVRLSERNTGKVIQAEIVKGFGPRGLPGNRRIRIPIYEITLTMELTAGGKTEWTREQKFKTAMYSNKNLKEGQDPMQMMRHEPWNHARSWLSRNQFPKEFYDSSSGGAGGTSNLQAELEGGLRK